ncbi:TPA: hypothetical protein J0W29_002664 [Enterococcus faecium]|nr:hypothetical protein [Enterococcus faecium]
MVRNQEKIVFLEAVSKVSQKSGNSYYVVTLADPVQFENYDFFVDQDLFNQINSEFQRGDLVDACWKFNKSGRNLSLQLVSLENAV